MPGDVTNVRRDFDTGTKKAEITGQRIIATKGCNKKLIFWFELAKIDAASSQSL